MKYVLTHVGRGLIERNAQQPWIAPSSGGLRVSRTAWRQLSEGTTGPVQLTPVDGIAGFLYNEARRILLHSPEWQQSTITVSNEIPQRHVGPNAHLIDRILCGDAMQLYAQIASDSIPLIVTSPPYWRMRKYGGGPNELGRERNPSAYIENLIAHTMQWLRILAPDGNLYLNLGDAYFAETKGFGRNKGEHARKTDHHYNEYDKLHSEGSSCRNKQLLQLPNKVAIEMAKLWWILRNEIAWLKLNPIPSYSPDRRLPVHEKIFHFVKSETNFFDFQIAKRLGSHRDETRHGIEKFGKHQATFPETLIAPFVLTSSREGDVVFDPFAGAGTVSVVAKRCKRHWIGFELVKEFAQIANKRVAETQPVPYSVAELIRKNGIKPARD